MKGEFNESKALAEFIEAEIARIELEAARFEGLLADMLVAEMSRRLRLGEGGTIQYSAANLNRASLVDRVFSSMSKGIVPLFDSIRSAIMSIIEGVAAYFRAGNFAAKVVEKIAENNAAIFAVVGITEDGLVAGGFLDRLSSMEQVRQELKNYVLRAVSSKMQVGDFYTGLREIVQGRPGTDGIMRRYLRQYAYDTLNQVREVKNKEYADGLGLRHFVYQGSIIQDSRAFCRKRAGKVFTTEEAKTWRSDPDLIDKKTAASYNPLLERGRYNCRHWIDYISEETYNRLKERQQ